MKKLLSVLLASATALSVCGGLAACGGGDDPNKLTVWAPEASIAGYEALAADFKKSDAKYADLNIVFQAKPEGEVETAIKNDRNAAADIFFFESGQISNMISKNFLQPLVGDYAKYATAIQGRDTEASYKAATSKDGKIMAFPATSDNGWFLWYDSEFYEASEVTSLDTILSKAKNGNKKVMFDYANGWYISSFWQGAGCTMDFEVKEDDSKEYKTDIDGTTGQAVATAIAKYLGTYATGGNATLIKPSSDINSEIPNGFAKGSVVAGFCGTWIQKGGARKFQKNQQWDETDAAWIEANGAKENGEWKLVDFEENGETKTYIASKDDPTKPAEKKISAMPDTAVPTKNPTFSYGTDKTAPMGSFMGGKYCGVNPSSTKKDVAVAFADYMTNQAGQLKRFEGTGAGPTNEELLKTEKVKKDKALTALSEQNKAAGYNQQSQASKFWEAMAAFGNACAKEDISGTPAAVTKALKDLVDALKLG